MRPIPAAAAVTWQYATTSSPAGWLPVAISDPDGALTSVPGVGPFPAITEARWHAERLVWAVADGELTLGILFETTAYRAPRPAITLTCPAVEIVRQCYGCNELIPANDRTCRACSADHVDCCTYEADLSVPELRCTACGAMDTIVSVNQGEARADIAVPADWWPGRNEIHEDTVPPPDVRGTGYECTSCGNPVTFDEEMKVRHGWTD